MKLVHKKPDEYALRDVRPPRWPNRPEGFAISAAPLGCDAEWTDITARQDGPSQALKLEAQARG